jgi:hypothetical protein
MKIAALMPAAALLFAAALNAEVTTNVKVPITLPAYIPCANGGTGEIVLLGGDLHILFTTTVSPSGRLTLTSQFQPQGVSGKGMSTGDKYQGTGVTRTSLDVDTVDGFPYVFTYVNNFRIIGQGPGNNSTVHMTIHTTINADGTVTATVDNTKVECK